MDHVRFPVSDAFEVLGESRLPTGRGGRLIVLLHAARNLPDRADEVRLAWTQAPPEAKADVRALVGELDAESRSV